MAEEIQTSSVESEQTSTDAAEVTGEIAQEVQQPQSNDTGSADGQQSLQVPEKYAGLDLSKLPDETRAHVYQWAQKREADQQRYITEKAQNFKNLETKAKHYDDYIHSDEYNRFKQWYSNSQMQSIQSQVPQSNPVVDKFKQAGFTDDEALSMADAVKSTVSDIINKEKQQFTQQFSTLQYQQRVMQAKQEIEALSKLHPDVNDMLNSGLLKMIAEQPGNESKTVEELYSQAKQVKEYFAKQTQRALSQEIKEKKAGTSAIPSSAAGNRDVIYVEAGETRAQTQNRIDDAAIKAAMEGRRVEIRVKNK